MAFLTSASPEGKKRLFSGLAKQSTWVTVLRVRPSVRARHGAAHAGNARTVGA
jgi:hypothetical protein